MLVIEKPISCRYALEHLKSSGMKSFVNGPDQLDLIEYTLDHQYKDKNTWCPGSKAEP